MSGVDNMNYMYSVNASNGTMRMFVNFDVKTDPNTDLILTQMRQNLAQPQLPRGRAKLRRDHPEGELFAPHARRPLFAEEHLRFDLPGELCQHQPHRPAPARARRCHGQRLRRGPVCDPHMGQARHPGQARHHRSRHGQCRAEAEYGQPGRSDRQRARAPRAGVHLHGPRPGPARLPRGIRLHRGPRQLRRLDRPPEGRGPHRAGGADLQHPGPDRRRACRHHGHLPVAGHQRARDRPGREER